jgi:hypothetical protein
MTPWLLQGEWILHLSALRLMNVGDNDLSGTLPKEIGRLTALQSLLADDNVGDNKASRGISLYILFRAHEALRCPQELKGTIPETIGQLVDLTVLNLDRNFIRGILPSSVSSVLRSLSLSVSQPVAVAAVWYTISSATKAGPRC